MVETDSLFYFKMVKDAKFLFRYKKYLHELQKQEDEKEESAMKTLHRIRMKNPLTQVERDPNTIYADDGDSYIAKLPSKLKPLPAKSILKKTSSELYIHPDIEWNEDKKYLRDPVVTSKAIKAREAHIRKMKEQATIEFEKEKLELLSQSSTDSEKDAKRMFGDGKFLTQPFSYLVTVIRANHYKTR